MKRRIGLAFLLIDVVLGVLLARPIGAQSPVATPGPGAAAPSVPPPAAIVATPAASTDTTEPPVATEPPDTGDPATSVKVGKGAFGFSIDLGDWIAKLLRGLWQALGVDVIGRFGDEIAGWLLRNPDLTTGAGQMGNVQRMADALRLASLSLVVVLFLVSVYRFWLGGEAAPQASLGRLLAVLFVLGFYKPLVGWLIGGSNALTDGVLHAGMDAARPSFGAILAAIPDTGALWSLAGVIALAFLMVIGVVRLLGFAFLLVLYVAGPLVLPLGLVPETAGYCAMWAKHGAKMLFWPVIWAIEFRLFDALREGLYLPDTVGHAILAPFAALGMLLVMVKTPILLHSGSFEQHARTAGRAARTVVVTMATGGAGGAAAGASAGAGSATASTRAAQAAASRPVSNP